MVNEFENTNTELKGGAAYTNFSCSLTLPWLLARPRACAPKFYFIVVVVLQVQLLR